MKLSCLLGNHKWFDGKCRLCGKPYTDYGPMPQLEGRILRCGSLVDRAMIVNALPQEPLVYLAENATNFSVVDMALPRIKDEDEVARIALKRGNRDVAYKAVILCDKVENIEKFIDSPEPAVQELAKKKLEAAKLATRAEIEEYLSRNRYRMDGSIENYLKRRLTEM